MKHIIFDLDGTLINSTKGILKCLRYAMECMDRPCPNDSGLMEALEGSIFPTFRNLLETDDENLVAEGVRLFRKRYSEVGVYEYEIYPGVNKLLDILLKDGYRLYIVTNKEKEFTARIIGDLPFGDMFLEVIGSESDDTVQNKADLITKLIKNRNLRQDESVYVGDRIEDIAAGKSCGICTISVTYGAGAREEIINSNPDTICHEPFEILKAVRNRKW